jgi:hypothetical protein
MVAAGFGDAGVVELLLAAGADASLGLALLVWGLGLSSTFVPGDSSYLCRPVPDGWQSALVHWQDFLTSREDFFIVLGMR